MYSAPNEYHQWKIIWHVWVRVLAVVNNPVIIRLLRRLRLAGSSYVPGLRGGMLLRVVRALLRLPQQSEDANRRVCAVGTVNYRLSSSPPPSSAGWSAVVS